MRFSVRARAQSALFRRVRFSSPAQTRRHLTQRRILRRRSHVKAQSATVTSRKTALCTGDATSTWPKGAFWTGDVTEKRTLRVGLTKRRILHASGGCAESLFSPICVHSCVPTSARNGVTVYTSAPRRRREAIFADLCTLLHTHNRSRGRAGPRVPRHRRPHGPRDARALGPEVHATRAVTQPPTYTNSRSLSNWIVHVACSR